MGFRVGLVTSCALLRAASASEWVPSSAQSIQDSLQGFVPGVEDLACFGGFVGLAFNISDFSKYPDYFSEDSFIEIPPGGVYKGVDSIIEYSQFLTPEGGLMVSRELVVVQDGYSGIDADGLCVFTQFFVAARTATNLGNDEQFSQTAAVKIMYNKTSNKIAKVYTGYTPESLVDFFSVYDTNTSAERFCDTYENNCPTEWTLDGQTSQQACLAQYWSLPHFDGTYHFDGNSRSCRMMHTSFAKTNPSHCPHISFGAHADESGDIKCQVSLNNPIEGPWTTQEWGSFLQFNIDQGFPTGFGAYVTIPPTTPSEDSTTPHNHDDHDHAPAPTPGPPAPSPAPQFMGACTGARMTLAVAAAAMVVQWIS